MNNKLTNPLNNDDNILMSFKFDQFDGPIDLLVMLIKEKKMDIFTLNIADLTEQYLNFVNYHLTSLPIDDISEYLVMASYLVELKTKMLLPLISPTDEPDETELKIDRLRKQLFLYKQFKNVVGEFRMRQYDRVKFVAKKCDDLDEYVPDELPEAPLPNNIPIDRLIRAWQRVVFNNQNNIIDKTFLIKVNNIDMEKIQTELTTLISHKDIKDITLSELIKLFDPNILNLEYMCAIFMSLLVLAKNGLVNIRQEDNNKTIFISKNTETMIDIVHNDIKEIVKSQSELSQELLDIFYKKK